MNPLTVTPFMEACRAAYRKSPAYRALQAGKPSQETVAAALAPPVAEPNEYDQLQADLAEMRGKMQPFEQEPGEDDGEGAGEVKL